MKKYIHVKESILAEISSGSLKTGDKLPVREELIKEYKVTRATLNKALGELISEGRLVASRKLGTFVAEEKRILKTVLVSDFNIDSNPLADVRFYHRMETLKHVIISLGKGKMDFLDSGEAARKLDLLSRYDSVIWIMPLDRLLKDLKKFKHKVIVVNRYADGMSYISTDHRKALYDMTEYMLDRYGNDCKLTYLDIPDESFIAAERRKGFIEACEKKNKFYSFCRMTGNFEHNVEVLSQIDFVRGGKVKNLIISPSRITTGAVLRMAYEKGLKPGHDFIYSDFDNADSLMNSGVRIPSVLQDYKRMGEEVIKAAKRIWDERVQVFVPHHLVNL